MTDPRASIKGGLVFVKRLRFRKKTCRWLTVSRDKRKGIKEDKAAK